MPQSKFPHWHIMLLCSEAHSAEMGIKELNLKQTIPFLVDYLQSHISTLPLVVQKLAAALDQMREYFNLGHSEIVETIYEQALRLPSNEFILFPSDWYKRYDHLMIYKLEKTSESSLLFSIYTTDYNEQSPQQVNLHRFDPVIRYEIPAAEWSKDEFKYYFISVFSQLIWINKLTIPTENFYSHILTKLSYLGAKLVLSKPNKDEHFIYGQLTANTAHQILNSLLVDHFNTYEEYQQLMYAWRTASLNQYLMQLEQEHELSNPQKIKSLRYCIESNLRFLNMRKSNGDYLFTQEYKKTELARIQPYLEQFREAEKKIPQYSINRPCFPKRPKEYFSRALKELERPKEKNEHVKHIKSPDIHHTRLTGDSTQLIMELKAFSKELNELYSNHQYDEALQRLEELVFKSLPLPLKQLNEPLNPLYQSINDYLKAKDLFSVMQQLEFKVREHLSRTHMVFHISINFAVIMMHVFSALLVQDQENNSLWRALLSYLPISKEIHHCASIASYNPSIDDRFDRICALLPTEYLSSSTLDAAEAKCYQEVLQKKPLLNQLGNSLFLIQKKYEMDNYLLRMMKWEKLNNEEKGRMQQPESPAQKLLQLEHDQLHSLYGFHHTPDLMSLKTPLETLPEIGFRSIDSPIAMQDDVLSDWNELKQLQAMIAQLRVCLGIKPMGFFPTTIPFWGMDFASSYQNKYSFTDPTVPKFNWGENHDSRITLEQISLLDKEKLFLRYERKTQILLTLDYFCKNPQHVKRSGIPYYIEANLMQSGLLLAQLRANAPSFFRCFNHFMQVGLLYHKEDNTLTPEGIFYIRIGYLVYHYAAAVQAEHISHLNNFYQQLTALIQSCSNPSIKSNLHLYRYLTVPHLSNMRLITSPYSLAITLKICCCLKGIYQLQHPAPLFPNVYMSTLIHLGSMMKQLCSDI